MTSSDHKSLSAKYSPSYLRGAVAIAAGARTDEVDGVATAIHALGDVTMAAAERVVRELRAFVETEKRTESESPYPAY